MLLTKTVLSGKKKLILTKNIISWAQLITKVLKGEVCGSLPKGVKIESINQISGKNHYLEESIWEKGEAKG